MQNDPLISIILPVYNGEKYLEKSIESCLCQTHRNIELIIIDDCSTDGSYKIAEEFQKKDERVQLISNDKNLKLPTSLNIGHKKAKGDYLTWTSHDNIYHEEALEVLLNNLLRLNADVVYANHLIIDENGKIKNFTKLKPIEYLLFSGVIGACFLYKKEVYIKNSGYNEKLHLVEDFDFWLRSLRHSRFAKIDNPVYYYYRYHPDSLTESMKVDSELKNQFLENLSKVYSNLFSGLDIQNKEFLINILLERFKSLSITPIRILDKKGIFEDLNKIAGELNGYRASKLRKFIIDDLVEIILKNREYQNFNIFYKIHKEAKSDLLNLPARRYLALFKKCIF